MAIARRELGPAIPPTAPFPDGSGGPVSGGTGLGRYLVPCTVLGTNPLPASHAQPKKLEPDQLPGGQEYVEIAGMISGPNTLLPYRVCKDVVRSANIWPHIPTPFFEMKPGRFLVMTEVSLES